MEYIGRLLAFALAVVLGIWAYGRWDSLPPLALEELQTPKGTYLGASDTGLDAGTLEGIRHRGRRQAF